MTIVLLFSIFLFLSQLGLFCLGSLFSSAFVQVPFTVVARSLFPFLKTPPFLPYVWQFCRKISPCQILLLIRSHPLEFSLAADCSGPSFWVFFSRPPVEQVADTFSVSCSRWIKSHRQSGRPPYVPFSSCFPTVFPAFRIGKFFSLDKPRCVVSLLPTAVPNFPFGFARLNFSEKFFLFFATLTTPACVGDFFLLPVDVLRPPPCASCWPLRLWR